MVMSQLTLPSFVCQLFTLLWESCTRLARKEASGVNFKTANFGFIVCLVIESGDGNENAASCILNFPLWTWTNFVVSRQRIFPLFIQRSALPPCPLGKINWSPFMYSNSSVEKSMRNLKSLFKNNKCALVLIFTLLAQWKWIERFSSMRGRREQLESLEKLSLIKWRIQFTSRRVRIDLRFVCWSNLQLRAINTWKMFKILMQLKRILMESSFPIPQYVFATRIEK